MPQTVDTVGIGGATDATLCAPTSSKTSITSSSHIRAPTPTLGLGGGADPRGDSRGSACSSASTEHGYMESISCVHRRVDAGAGGEGATLCLSQEALYRHNLSHSAQDGELGMFIHPQHSQPQYGQRQQRRSSSCISASLSSSVATSSAYASAVDIEGDVGASL